MDYKIIPGVGFEEVQIDMPLQKLEEILGAPDEIENLDDEFFEDVHEAIWHYNELYIYPIVDMDEKRIVSILCDHPEATLFGKKIMPMSSKELTKHLKDNGIKKLEIDEEYIECEEEGLNFIYEGGKMDLVDIDHKVGV